MFLGGEGGGPIWICSEGNSFTVIDGAGGRARQIY